MDLTHLTDKQREEAESCIAWLDRRLDFDHHSFRFYVDVFKRDWEKSVGSQDLIPMEYISKVMNLYREKKAKYEEDRKSV
jgi:hypothetical protein